MPKQAFNDKVVKSLPIPLKTDKPNQVDYWDTAYPAFGLRISYNGARTWVVAVRINGGPVRRKIGRYPAMTLAQARRRAVEVQEAARNGIDPSELERAERRKRQAEQLLTFAAVRDEFVRDYRKKGRQLRTMSEYERALKAVDFKEWESRAVSSITNDDVADLMESMIKAGTGIKANRTLSYLQTFFKWAREKKNITGPIPTDGIKPPAASIKRDRVLNEDELRIIWRAVNETAGIFAPLIKVLLLTGVRKEEAGGMEWRELFDLEGTEPRWDIPGERMKMDRGHRVHLSTAAAEVLKAMDKSNGLVFSTTGTTPLSGYSRVKSRIDARIAEICTSEHLGDLFRESWTLHDFRRTFKTLMRNLGVPGDVLALCLHHKRQGVDAVYDWSDLPIERRAAMDIWAEYVACVTEKPLADSELAHIQRQMRREYHRQIRGDD